MINFDNLIYFKRNKKDSYNHIESFGAFNKKDRDIFEKHSQNISFGSISKPLSAIKPNNSLTSLEKRINRAYKKFIEETPFSDLGRIYIFLGIKTPPHLEDNTCLGLCEMLKKNYEALGYDKNYFLKLEDAPHYVLISEVNGETFLSDAQALLTGPINLTRIKNSPTKQQDFNFYPYYPDKNGRKSLGNYRVRFVDENRIEISAAKPGKQPKRSMFFDLTKKTKQKPNPFTQELAFDKGHTYFQLRVFDENPKKTVKLVYPIKEHFESKTVDENKLYITDSDFPEKQYSYGSKQFDKYMKLISKKFKLSIGEVKSYILQGVKLYYENAPKDFHFDD